MTKYKTQYIKRVIFCILIVAIFGMAQDKKHLPICDEHFDNVPCWYSHGNGAPYFPVYGTAWPSLMAQGKPAKKPSVESMPGPLYPQFPMNQMRDYAPLRMDTAGKLYVKCGDIYGEAVLSCDSIKHEWVDGPMLMAPWLMSGAKLPMSRSLLTFNTAKPAACSE